MPKTSDKMPVRVVRALKGSIRKWDQIAEGLDEDRGTVNCPLCAIFYDRVPTCEGCPVSTHTGRSYCEGSPYDEWVAEFESECAPSGRADTPDRVLAAEAMRDFLKGLLPPCQ